LPNQERRRSRFLHLSSYAGRTELEEIIAGESRTDRAKRDKEVAVAVRYGYTLKEIAGHLGVHYATVSRALKRA
jgi:DNA-binding NarL/FixJ family response regulator